MKKIVLKIGGMTCSACSSGLEKYLNKQKGIISANVNLVLSTASIEYEDIKINEIEKYVKEAGFNSLGEFKGVMDSETNKSDTIKLILMGILLIFLMYVSMGHMINLPSLYLFNHHNPIILVSLMLVVTLVFIWYGFDIIKSGIKNLIHLMPNMDTLVTFSVVFSFLYSFYGYINIIMGNVTYLNNLYFDASCMVIYFIKLGRYIESMSKDKTKDAIKQLVQITPQKALLKVKDDVKEVSIDEVQVDDILVCRAGDKIACDGEVIKGKTYVDESFITGESKPVLKEKGSKVIAGSISYDGYIEYQAKKIGRDSTISEIVKLVVNATNGKNKIQRLADKISGYFVPIILVLAGLTFIIHLLLGTNFNDALIHMVTVLVVACPCAIGLAVPLVVVVSNGLCAKKGLFLRDGEVIEKAKDIDTIVFDKTGTLTYGKLNIFKIFNYSNYSDGQLINIVANIEKNSTHPISRAFKVNRKLDVINFKNLDGMGIYGEIDNKKYYLGNDKILKKLKIRNKWEADYQELLESGCSIIFIVENEQVMGLIGVKDIIRKEVKEVIKKFAKNNIDVIMLTGDNEKTALVVANELGITKVKADVIPKEKALYIKQLVDDGKKVIMVGDGINDAPSLVNATIGVSVNDGTDVAMDTASVILMNNDMGNILDLIGISKKSYKIIKQNLFWAFFYNLVMLPIAMGLFSDFGINMSPMFGSIAMTISSLTVVLNSLRLRRMK